MSGKSTWLSRLETESGLRAIRASSRDAKLMCAQRFVRLFAYGMSFLILVQFLSTLDISDRRIGLFMTLTLIGDTLISFVLTLITDKIGRRNVLTAGCALMVMSGLVFSMSSSYWILLLASVIGVISPSGNEIGPFRAIEESILAQLTSQDERSDVFAWYTLFGTAGAALGTVTSGFIVQGLQSIASWRPLSAYRVIFFMYGAIGAVKLALTLMLSSTVEIEAETSYEAVNLDPDEDDDASQDSDVEGGGSTANVPAMKPHNNTPTGNDMTLIHGMRSLLPHISPQSRSILMRLMLLFIMDSFASGLASPSWLTYYFTNVHGLKPATLGTLFLVTNLLAAISNLVALPMARRLGNVKTMVFTHLPSAICLALVPVFPSSPLGTWLAMAFLSLRACTQSMDQAPRQAFLAAAVLAAERTAVLGIVNIGKTMAQAGGIGTAGVLAGPGLWVVLFGGAGLLKATYDLFMLWMFLGLKSRS